ncbi:hypothetical protein B2J67_09510, partial [Vibrio cholerae]
MFTHKIRNDIFWIPKEIVDKNEIYNGIIRFIKSKTCIEIKESIVGQLKNSWRNVEKGIDYTWIIDNKDDELYLGLTRMVKTMGRVCFS